MPSQPTRTRKRDKFKALLRGKTPQLPVASNNIAATSISATLLPLQSSDNVVLKVPNISHIPPPPQKTFVKGKFFEKDIAILSAAYILEQYHELKRLIHLVVVIHEKDKEDKLTDVLETCAKFSVQLVSAIQAHRAEVMEAITVFILTVEKINTAQLDGDAQSFQALRNMVNDDIAKIKSSHPIFVTDRDIGTSEGLFKVLWTTLWTGITFLDIVKEASALIPVPWLRPVIGGVISLLNAVMQTRSNYDDMKQIAATAGDFVLSCAVIHSDRTTDPSNELKRALNKFTRTLECIAQECDELSRLNPFRRYLEQNVQNGNLQAIRTRLNNAIELFQTESQVNIQLDIHDLRRNLDYAALNTLPNHPRYKPNEYLDGSQDDVLRHISSWIDEPKELVLWMHGAAGLGKSTAAQRLVHLLQSTDRLAGGIFLTNLTSTEHPETVIQMISRQLGENHPRAIASIAEAARKLQGPHRSLRDYLMAYIIDPVRALEYPYQLVTVIDGLDEWESHESFLAGLTYIPSPSPLKVVLISRPNHSIGRVLKEIPVQQYKLPPVSQEIIERYFDHHFKRIEWRGRIPDQHTINRLAAHANGLLIWAATVRSLLSHELDKRYPHVILEQILWSEEKVGTRKEGLLGRLYHDAIESLFPETDMRQQLEDFLGAMMVLQESLPIRDFARLLGMSERPAEEIQRRLAALQTRGNVNRDVIPPAIQQFHVSFLDFIESPSTDYNERPISINTTNTHSMLADKCLEIVFSELLQSYRGQTCSHSELRGVERYAVKFWPLHVSNGTPRLPLPLAATRPTRDLIDISEKAMRRWITLFLPCVAARFQDGYESEDGYESLDNTPRSALPYKLAKIIGMQDVTTLLYHIHCLEIAVRLQPIDVETWRALGGAYRWLYEHGRYNKNLDEAIAVFRQALELVSPKSGGKESSNDIDVDVAREVEKLELTNASGTDTHGNILLQLAHALRTRFDWQGASNDLDETISLLREAFALRPASHQLWTHSLNDLAVALEARFEQHGASNDLNEAISLLREALVLQPAPHPGRSMTLHNLARSLQACFKQQGSSNDLDEAISLLQEALVLRPAPHPLRFTSFNNLANALLTRFNQWGASDDLDGAIFLLREALVLHPGPHPLRSLSLNNLAASLLTCFDQRGASNDLDEAISLLREALVLLPALRPDRSQSLDNLASSLVARFNQQGALNDLEEAISLHREALVLKPSHHPDRSMALHNLASSLQACFKQWGCSNDLDEAISLLQEALVLRPALHPLRSTSLNNLANALQTRFEYRGASNDLDKAISLHREALVLRPAPHPYHSKSLNNLANALEIRFEQRGASNDLDEAIFLYREALVLHAAPHPFYSFFLDDLANALRTRFEQWGDSNDLDEAISLFQGALALRPAPDPVRSTLLNNLAQSLRIRFKQQGTSNDLEEAVSLHREVLVLLTAAHADRPMSLYDLANTLRTRFELQGTLSDLEEAIYLYREVLVLLPASHPTRYMPVHNLADALLHCFKHWGTANDLDESIYLHREAIDLLPAPHPDRSISLSGLAVSLQSRFEQQGTSNDLDEAISLYREALDLRPAPHPRRYMPLNNLANALLDCFERRGTTNDLDEVISLRREVLLSAPHPHRTVSLNNLAIVLLIRFGQRGASDDLDEAISLLREVLTSVPRPSRSKSLKNLASALLTRFEEGGTLNDLDEAISLLQDVLSLRPASHPRHSVSLKNALQTRSDQRGVSNEHA